MTTSDNTAPASSAEPGTSRSEAPTIRAASLALVETRNFSAEEMFEHRAARAAFCRAAAQGGMVTRRALMVGPPSSAESQIDHRLAYMRATLKTARARLRAFLHLIPSLFSPTHWL